MIKIMHFIRSHKRIIIFFLVLFLISTTFVLMQPWLLSKVKQSPQLYSIYHYISNQIEQRSLLWLFIATFIGSIFVFSSPVELIFVYYILTGANVFLSLIVATAGIMSARCINFFIGSKFRYLNSNLRQRSLEFKKKFRSTQTTMIYIGNFFPAFPIEHYSVFQGTTHYRFKKFFLHNTIAKLLKLVIIAVFLKLLLWNFHLLNISFYDLIKDFMGTLFNLVH